MVNAKTEIKGVLVRNWDPNATSYGETPPIKTVSYDRDDPLPCLVLDSKDEGPVAGSQTPFYAMDGDGGGGVLLIDGAVTVECVAGAAEDLEGDGPNGGNINPDQLRDELYRHAADVLTTHQDATDLMFVAPGEATEIVDRGGESGALDVFRTQFRARYQYQRRP